MSAFLEVADRCEQAAGPDRELDRAIQLSRCTPGIQPILKPNYFTASIDAAMALVPEINGQTAYPQLQRVGVDTWQAHLGYTNKAKGATGNARTPALAICAGALRALASAGEADRPKRGETRGSVHEHAAPSGETPRG